jgi:aryl-alcohol dehydrogenase-like predicted oxidoreductase
VRTRRLGPQGPEVSALGLGCMGISQSYGDPDPEGGLATLRSALDRGITFFDTADAYGWGANEELVGRALREHRDEVFLATKCGFVAGPEGAPSRVDGSPEHIRAACDASLRRLGVKTIDLYYLHRVDPRVPIEDSVRAMAGLVKEGKVRYLGLSEIGPEKLRKAHAVHPITAVQSEYSLFTRDPEDGVLPVCRELGIGFVPFSPLGRGVLTGAVRSLEGLPRTDFRRGVPRFQPGNLERNLEKVERLIQVAREKGCTPAQLTLAWLLAQGPHIVPIPGTKHSKYLEENVAAVALSLSPGDLAKVEEAVPKGSVAGDRYSPSNRSLVDR